MYMREDRMPLVFLTLAICAEVLGTTLLKLSAGFTRPWPALGSLGAYGLSFALLAQALRGMGVGVAYAIWSGVGTALIVLIGVVFLREPITLVKVTGVALVVAGVVTLQLGGAH
nr:MAG: ligand-binding protein SH3 [Actinomycetota bacterium]